MPKTIVYRLPKSEDDEVLKIQSRPMKLIRLKSLQLDPASFHSKYDVEVKYEQELWLSRLRGKHVQHFVLMSVDDTHDEKREIPLDDTTEFLGVMVVINEYEEESVAQTKSGKVADSNSWSVPTYFLGYLYVDSSLRSQGLGTKIIKESIAWIKEDARSKDWPSVRYRVTAMHGNDRAVNLYVRNGFKVDSIGKHGDDSDDVYTQLSMVIETGQ